MRTIITFLLSAISCMCFAQNANVQWGGEFKMTKGSADLSVIHADKSGIFVKETHLALKSYFVLGTTVRESGTLIKMTSSLDEEYRNDYNKELKGKEFEEFIFINDKLYMIASGFVKKDNSLTLYFAELNKKDGNMLNGWKEISTWTITEKDADINFNFIHDKEKNVIRIMSSNLNAESNVYEIKEFNADWQYNKNTIWIRNEFDPKTFVLEDVLNLSNKNTLVLGKEYEYKEGKKKKDKNLVFKNYVIRLHDQTGKMIKNISPSINNKYLMSAKALQVNANEIFFSAFYSNDKININGLVIQRIDAANGNVIKINEKELSFSDIKDVATEEDSEGETRKERKEREKFEKMQEEEAGFSKYMAFRKFVSTEDNGMVIIAEKYREYTYTTTSSAGRSGTSYSSFKVNECGDLLMTKVDSSGQISWIKILPKNQKERTQMSSGFTRPNSLDGGNHYFAGKYLNLPFYAGVGIVESKNSNILIVFNDSPKNIEVSKPGQMYKTMENFGFTLVDTHLLTLNPKTGEFTRKLLYNDKEIPVSMPRLGVAFGNDFYITAKQNKGLGKTKMALGKITFK